jgi:hypothetical protein
MRKLKASDLEKVVLCDISISFDTPRTFEGDDTPGPIPKSSVEAGTLGADDFKQRFGVSDEVARRLLEYQSDIQAEFMRAIGEMKSQSVRYVAVKEFLDYKKYDEFLLNDFIYHEMSAREIDPQYHLYNGILKVVLSFTLLGVAAASALNHSFGLSIDPVGGWIIATVWGGLTLLAALGIPKRYRTRRVLDSLSRAEKLITTHKN